MNGWPPPSDGIRRELHSSGDSPARLVACIADRPATMIDMLESCADRIDDREALICDDFRCSWDELRQLVDLCAQGLLARGVSAGDRVILFLGNRAEFVLFLLALSRIGAIAVPVGIREQAPGLAYIAGHSGACAIVHEADLADRIPHLGCAIPLADQDVRQFCRDFASDVSLPQAAPREDDTALIMYTSGTTGRPKGAVITHLALVHVAAAYVNCMALTEQDRSACVVPLSHVTGITAMVAPMLMPGGTMIIVPHFEAKAFAALAERERMTHTLLVPAMYNLLLARVDLGSFDLSTWRIGAFGGAPMPVPTIETIAEALPGLGLMNCYGATETCGAVAIMPADSLLEHSDSVGWAVPGIDILVMDADGREVPTGQSGEIWIGGASVTPGYWQDVEATNANLIAGFWRSGDIGSVDENGFVRVLDRLKDMINRGGYKIFTAEVESILMEHPAVLEAAVVAKPCPVLGERVHAFIVARDEATAPGEDDLRSYCASRMTDYKQPESYTIGAAPLPRNLNGKVVKADLRASLGF